MGIGALKILNELHQLLPVGANEGKNRLLEAIKLSRVICRLQILNGLRGQATLRNLERAGKLERPIDNTNKLSKLLSGLSETKGSCEKMSVSQALHVGICQKIRHPSIKLGSSQPVN
jgi:hypothetical protein